MADNKHYWSKCPTHDGVSATYISRTLLTTNNRQDTEYTVLFCVLYTNVLHTVPRPRWQTNKQDVYIHGSHTPHESYRPAYCHPTSSHIANNNRSQEEPPPPWILHHTSTAIPNHTVYILCLWAQWWDLSIRHTWKIVSRTW